MNRLFKLTMVTLLSTGLISSCASTTLINSEPSGAKIYVDGGYLGKTPFTYSDTKIVGATTQITLKKEGCTDANFIISRNEKFEVGPCIGGVLVLVPFLWIMGYNPSRSYELECSGKTSEKFTPTDKVSLLNPESSSLASTWAYQCPAGS